MSQLNLNKKTFFKTQLLNWHLQSDNIEMPWETDRDPYKIWVLEIIMQQTQVQQGLPYYHRFITKYPNVKDLANTNDDDLMKIWQGLGYYTRCRNLKIGARQIMDRFNGKLPTDYNQLIQIAGIGPYTASAIASFAYDRHYAVVDGNVYRILARFFNIKLPIDSAKGKKKFSELANALIKDVTPSDYNQAIMDFGATVCTSKKPKCHRCPLSTACEAYALSIVNELPIKNKITKIKNRYFIYIVIYCQGRIYMQKRSESDIWKSLYEPFLIEFENTDAINDLDSIIKGRQAFRYLKFIGKYTQKLTHQVINSFWFKAEIDESDKEMFPNGRFYDKASLQKLALPKTIFSILSKKITFRV